MSHRTFLASLIIWLKNNMYGKENNFIMSQWNSEQYLKFENQRTQPAIDLAKRITIEQPNNILDIGCGPGNSTAVLKNSVSAR